MKGVYKITSKVNGKYYIGRSSNITARKAEHFIDLKKNKHCNDHLQNHYNKYGKEDLIWEILCYCEEDKECVKIEQMYLDTGVWKNMFNISKSSNNGDSGLSRIVHMYSSNGIYIKEFPSLRSAAIEMFNNSILSSNIRQACLGIRVQVGDYMWNFEKLPQLPTKYIIRNVETGEEIGFNYSGKIAEYFGQSYKSGTAFLRRYQSKLYKNKWELRISPIEIL